LIEYPRKGVWVIAFQTGEAKEYIYSKLDNSTYSYVFVPTTPNPTSGFMLLVKTSDIVETDLTFDEAIKLIISGGSLDPRELNYK